MEQKIFVLLTLLLFSTASRAATAYCNIEIQDVLKGTIYTVEQKFNFEYGATTGQRKHFDVPGNDYSCTFAFFEEPRKPMSRTASRVASEITRTRSALLIDHTARRSAIGATGRRQRFP